MIAFHLVQFLQPRIPVSRITFNAVTKKAIEEALQTPRDIDADLVEAVRTRRVLNRLFGFEPSPGLQTLLASAASTIDPRGLWAIDLGAYPESGHRVYVRCRHEMGQSSDRHCLGMNRAGRRQIRRFR
jgi:reverse gyrase